MAGSGSTSAPRRAGPSRRRSPARRPSSGTGRWASSSGRASPRARGPSPKLSPAPTRTRLSAGPTRSARWPSWGSSRRWTGPRPAEEPPSSCWKGKNCPAWRRFRRTDVLIAGNWKMYKGPAETAEFCIELKRQLADLEAVDVAVCPPFTSLAVAVQVLAGTDIAVAAQNVHWEPEGAFTGEVSAPMLRELGVYGAIVGHSERRQLFGETDEGVGKRARAALDAGLSGIACVGETE